MAPPAGDIDLSMNEIETTALKAARGAGLSWGVAEEVGRAARWLAATGADWAGALVVALAAPEALDPRRSPFLVGTALADSLGAAPPPAAAVVEVAWPVWLVAVLAAGGPDPLTLRLGGLSVRLADGAATASAPLSALLPLAAAEVAIGGAPAPAPLPHAFARRVTRGRVAAADHAALEALVYRTYVPTSERSRLRGAGARR